MIVLAIKRAPSRADPAERQLFFARRFGRHAFPIIHLAKFIVNRLICEYVDSCDPFSMVHHLHKMRPQSTRFPRLTDECSKASAGIAHC